jgi:tetratricopeptide (TPR) repeat protein
MEVCFHEESVYGAPESAGGLSVTLAEPGEIFGDYELLEEIARGGMGVVFRARQRSLDRLVALKMMLPGRLSSQELVRRFRMEAEAASRLRHPGIVSIHEVGQCQGQHYYSMDYIDGCDLVRRVEAGPVAPALAARWIQSVAEAIHHAHQHGILHRDLKPANVLLDAASQPHVTDFGLAKLLDEGRDLTATGHVLGTPSFMPPEQASPERGAVTVASDVYGLGAIFYFLLTGKGPFDGESLEHTLKLLLTSDPEPPSRCRPGIPRDLETICLKCLNKEPQRRYASAAELADDLGAWSRREPIRARPVSVTERLWYWSRRNPVLAGVSGGLVATIIVGAILQQHALTETRRAKASAEGLLQFMITDLTEELKPIGRLRLLDNVNRTVQRYYQGSMKDTPVDPRAGKIQFYQNNAAVQREMGRMDEALESARSAIALLDPLLQAEPNQPQWAFAMAKAHEELRNTLDDSDSASAFQHAQETVRFFAQAHALRPEDEQTSIKLANARLELAVGFQDENKTLEADDQLRLATELLAKLPNSGTNSFKGREQLALSDYYRGVIQYGRGDKQGARRRFESLFENLRQLADEEDNPEKPGSLLNLAIAHGRLGQALMNLDDAPAALNQFREYQRLSQDLEQRDPGNVRYRSEVGRSFAWLALALRRAGGAPNQIDTALLGSWNCFQKLAAEFPQGDFWQDQAARALTAWAERQNEPGHRAQALALAQDQVNRCWTLLVQSPARHANHRRFIQALDLAELYARMNDTLYTERIARLRPWMSKADAEGSKPGASPEWNGTRGSLHHRIADGFALEKDYAKAQSELELALPLWQQFATEKPVDADAVGGLARVFAGINLAHAHAGAEGQRLDRMAPFLAWLQTTQATSVGLTQTVKSASFLQAELDKLEATWSPREQEQLRQFDEIVQKLKASTSNHRDNPP